jgi:hypothetical protein
MTATSVLLMDEPVLAPWEPFSVWAWLADYAADTLGTASTVVNSH